MRSCLAVHIAGDQHMASTVQYGIDDFNDGPYWHLQSRYLKHLPQEMVSAKRRREMRRRALSEIPVSIMMVSAII